MSRFQLFSDAQWALIADLILPVRTGQRGSPFSGRPLMVEGIIYRYRCGIAWRDLPEVFGPWQTVWTWHRRLTADGTWDPVLAMLLATADAAGEHRLGDRGGFHDRAGASARDKHRPPHRGLGRITTNPQRRAA